MSLRLRLILGAAAVLALAQYFVMHTLRNEIRPRYKEVIEDGLVETAHLLAATLSGPSRPLDAAKIREAVETVKNSPLHASIHGVEKTKFDFSVYVTDDKGIVLYDSEDPANIGKDFSKWNDVLLTLQGKYGTRSTRRDPDDKLSSIMYVAAPVENDGKIKGVVSVGKSEKAVEGFLMRTQENSTLYMTLVFLLVFGAIVILSTSLTRPIHLLTEYARKNRGVERVPLPSLSLPEFRELGTAFEEMRISIEGKKTIEQFVQALTHELKSPLTAIRGAAELALEDMPAADRARFLENIRSETGRIQKIVDYLLEIAALENRTGLKNPESVDLTELANEIAEAARPFARTKNVNLRVDVGPAAAVVFGEKFLLFQAVRNLVQNALEHAEPGSDVEIRIEAGAIRVFNTGEPIPDFAKARLFEKFYSLAKPDTEKKSSGLGLTFAREVATLHSATLIVANRDDGARGVEARLSFSPIRDFSR